MTPEVIAAAQQRASNRIASSLGPMVGNGPPATENLDFDSRYVIPWTDVKCLQLIGEGSTATVMLADFRGERIAVKELLVACEGGHMAFQRELDVLVKVKHPHIVQFLGIINNQDDSVPSGVNEEQLRLCLELCEGGSLWDLLYNRQHVKLAWWQRIVMLYDTATAVAHMHGCTPKVVHRDLKSLNVLLKSPVVNETVEPHVKLCDFGFAREHWSDATMTVGAGTSHWMAPEVITGSRYTEAADSFSFAVIGYEVVCRCIPFYGTDLSRVQVLLTQGHRPLPDGVHSLEDESGNQVEVPPGLIELITRCWHQDPMMRPDFNSIWMEIVEVSRNTSEDLKEATPEKLYGRSSGVRH